MKRQARLESAKHWIPKYEGKSLVRGYVKHFAVDQLCAIMELRLLGIEISAKYIEQAVATQRERERQGALRRERKKQAELTRERELQLSEYGCEGGYDDYYGFIAGFTSNGFAYGIPWDEWRALNEKEEKALHQDDHQFEYEIC